MWWWEVTCSSQAMKRKGKSDREKGAEIDSSPTLHLHKLCLQVGLISNCSHCSAMPSHCDLISMLAQWAKLGPLWSHQCPESPSAVNQSFTARIWGDISNLYETLHKNAWLYCHTIENIYACEKGHSSVGK